MSLQELSERPVSWQEPQCANTGEERLQVQGQIRGQSVWASKEREGGASFLPNFFLRACNFSGCDFDRTTF